MWPGCKAFSWSTHNGGTCWLKSKKGVEIVRSGVKSAEVETTVIVDCILQYDIDYVDNDIANVPAKYPGDCCGICMGWSGCCSFSWSNLNGGTCWLKSVMGKTVSKPGVVSCKIRDNPPSSCTLEFDVDYVGNDIRNVPRVNPDDCCYQCRDTAGCRAFSWSNFNGGTCWLKNMKGATIPKSGVTSAVVF